MSFVGGEGHAHDAGPPVMYGAHADMQKFRGPRHGQPAGAPGVPEALGKNRLVAHGLDARAGGGAARFGPFGLIHNVYYVNYGINRGRPPDNFDSNPGRFVIEVMP